MTTIGTSKAIYGNVKNDIAGTGWTDTAGTEGETAIAASEAGQSLANYKKVHFSKPSHTHSFTYAVSGTTITATCTADGCTLPESSAGAGDHAVTLTITAPTLTTYGQTGEGISASATLNGLDNFKTATGLNVQTSSIVYWNAKIQEGVYKTDGDQPLTAAPTSVGNYLAKITVNNCIASVGYTIAPITISSVAVTDITAPTATATLDTAAASTTEHVTIAGEGAITWDPVTPQDGKAAYATVYKATVTAAADTNYAFADTVAATVNGQTATVTKNDGGTLGISYTFTKTALNPVTITPTNKSVDYSADGIAIPVDGMFTITEGAGEAAYAVENGTGEGTYDAQTGKLTVTKCGTFTVKVSTAATTTHAAGAETSATLTVNKVDSTAATVTANTLTYTGSAQALVTVTGEATGDTMQYALGTATEATEQYTTSIPTGTDAGTYYVWYKVVGDENHNDTDPACVTVTISAPVYSDDEGSSAPAAATVTIPVSGEDESVNVTVTVSDNTATVTGADVDKVLEAEDVGTVTIDVSALSENVDEVVIPNALLTKIADAVADESSTADGMEVKLPGGSVVFDADAVAAIAAQAGSSDLVLKLESIGEGDLTAAQKAAIADMDTEAVYDIYMTAGGKRISDFNGGSADVTVTYELKDGQLASGIIVLYVAENGETTPVPTTADGRFVYFTVSHFSNYVVTYDANAVANCAKDDTCPMAAFTDLDPEAWYHDGVHFALANGIMNGYGSGLFGPNDSTSRAMIVQILWNLEGNPAAKSAAPFDDVAEGAWYADAVAWASEQGIVEGYGDGKFGPDDPITREQLAAILYRYAQSKGKGFTGSWMFLLDWTLPRSPLGRMKRCIGW